ncbi:MAG: 3-hydroxyacyl-CoA dehydrogenase NAD-binding domain-containing protein [Desulfobacterales bacterium]|nr:3-hydroxyacyl-CoA dehydrogenase NAD-binding domain-containing protein [Desulfobacterales bacterium]MDP6681853.1 3-hydroxyacyl-CoA dehydrogenase NAD-binding domain-containing protein [Desulfobacterales bacterium]MDP6808517.1 3-hydroxyacyl-CoA dehydrogenase NAD-binding domain-containing protein [Desulfobacterales bacterium]
MDIKRKLYPSSLNPLLIESTRPLPKEIAVIGAGTIGPDIGYYLKSALPSIKLYLLDIAEEPLKQAEGRISNYAKKAVARKKMDENKAKTVCSNIVYTTQYQLIKDCDLIIEAATENIPLKQKIFATVEKIVGDEALITSNTSSIPADRLFSRMIKPERTTVTHFFAPAWRSLPVEVIRWAGSSPATIDFLFWFFAHTHKAPIITDNAICFVLDRIFDNWCNEAVYLLNDASASQIDKVVEAFAFAGPFFVLNMANGNPIIIETNSLQMEEGDHYRPADILGSVESWLTHRPGSDVKVPDDIAAKVRDRMLGILFSQSFDIVDRGIGTKEDLNFGCQVALGFRQGPLDIMQNLGEAEVNRITKKFESERPGFPGHTKPLSVYVDFKRHLLVDDVDGVKIITIRRPQAMNALNDEIMDEILVVLQAHAEEPSVSGYVITGYGNQAFSAGADISKFPEMLGDRQAAIQYTKDCARVQLFLDQMDKPVVAAINGLALGGGLELAIRCHSAVASPDARLQFPEITLGILPAIGGCVVPYRKWPNGAMVFHEMITQGKSIASKAAAEIGIIKKITAGYIALIQEAVAEVKRLKGKIGRTLDGKIEIPDITVPQNPVAGDLVLSKEAVSQVVKTIRDGAASKSFAKALEIGYEGFGEMACMDAAKEGISAFLEKRTPKYRK